MTSINGPRAASEMSIVFFAPSFEITVPAGMPKIAIGSISAARTHPIFAVDPVVTRTKNGRARHRIDEPVNETSSAAINPSSERFLNMPEKIIRTYVFVKCLGLRHAEGHAGAPRCAPRPDPGRRSARLRPVRGRRRHGRAAR